MESSTTLPKHVRDWLHSRGLSDSVIDGAHLYWKEGMLAIPIYNETGEYQFDKCRRDPAITDDSIPKYKNAQGAEATLFVARMMGDSIIICEGELDALLLATHGIDAVTSTGGSQTFKAEWIPLFDGKEVVICFDRDKAGIQGSIKLQELIPHAKIAWLPFFEGKDITDYIKEFGISDFGELIESARTYTLPQPFEDTPKSKAEIGRKKKEYAMAIGEVDALRRQANIDGEWVEPYVQLNDYLTKRYEHYLRLEKSFNRTGERDPNRVLAAKAVSIAQFIKFNMRGFAPCIWHDEKTPSMKYNREGSKHSNTVKCFGCGMMGDTIDVVMQINHIDFKEAVKKILGE